jgi:hypothetical protein
MVVGVEETVFDVIYTSEIRLKFHEQRALMLVVCCVP